MSFLLIMLKGKSINLKQNKNTSILLVANSLLSKNAWIKYKYYYFLFCESPQLISFYIYFGIIIWCQELSSSTNPDSCCIETLKEKMLSTKGFSILMFEPETFN